MSRTTVFFVFNYFFLTSFVPFCATLASDVSLGGIFSEHLSKVPGGAHDSLDDSPCGERNLRGVVDRVAVDFAVQEINNSEDILPGIKLGVDRKDSCNDLDHAIENTLDYPFVKRKFLNQTRDCPSLNATTEAPLVAIIAGGYSHIVKAIVNLVGLFKVPVIGYSSTSPSLNKIDYFLRTIPPDTVIAQVMVDLIQQLRWNIVLVLYADTEFGHYAANAFRTAIRQRNAKICIAFDEKFSKAFEAQELKKVVEGIRGVKKSRVVMFFGTHEDFVFFEEQSSTYFQLNDYVWITSEVWIRPDLIGIPRRLTNVLAIIPKQSFQRDRFYEYLRDKDRGNLTCLPTSQDATKHFQGTGTSRELIGMNVLKNCSLAHSKYIPLVFDAVYSVAVALHNMLECERGKLCNQSLDRIQDRSLLKHLRKLNFTNPLTNNTVSFDSNGNPNTAHYTAVKLEVGTNWYEFTLIGHWTCQHNATTCSGSLVTNNTGSINSSSFESNCGAPCAKGEHKSVRDEFPDCCWECKKCTGNKYSNTAGQMSCSKCPDDHWPNSNHTECIKIHPEFLNVGSASGTLIVLWNALGITLTITVGVVFVKYHSSHIVRASSRELSLLLLLGISTDFSLPVVLLVEPSRLKCTLLFVLSYVTSGLLSGTLFIKTNRIHRIFRKSAMKAHPRCMGNAFQLLLILALVTVEIALCVSILILQPEIGHVRTTYVHQGHNKKAFMLCHFLGNTFEDNLPDALLWSYNCGLIFICTYQAYLVRRVPENYNEARYITFTMVTISMNTVVYVITTSGMEDYNIQLVYCIFQSVRASVALGCMFFPKVYVILFQPENNRPHDPVQSQLGTFVVDKIILVKPNESKRNGLSTQDSDSSSVDSANTGPSRRILPTHKKVGEKVPTKDEGRNCHSKDNGMKEIGFQEYEQSSPKDRPSTEESLIESGDSKSVIIINKTIDSATKA